MKRIRNLIATSIILVAFGCIGQVLGQTKQSVEKTERENSAAPLASEVLSKVLANRDKVSLDIYPPGYVGWLQSQGDNPLPVKKSGALQSMMLQSLSGSDTLQGLADGGSLESGGVTFTGFSYQASGLTGFDPENILVTASTVDNVATLTIDGSIGMTVSTSATGMLTFAYSVKTASGSISLIAQSYAGGGNPNGAYAIMIDERAGTPGGYGLANSYLDAGDVSDPFAEVGDNLIVQLNPAMLRVVTKVILTSSQPASVAVSELTQSFTLVGTTPNPVEAVDVVTTQPTEKTYGVLPVKQPGKDNLIVVTYGWRAEISWLRAMTNSIGQYLANNGLTSWQVAGYEWPEGAQVLFPQSALENGQQDGYKLGKHIMDNGWTHVHFIAHSAGAGLINTASEFIYTNVAPITIHDTFLDPFTGNRGQETERYGRYSDWAESYFSSGDLPRTQSILPYAYNVNVTQLNKIDEVGAFISSGLNVGQPCQRAVASHVWPHDFYFNTIVGTVTSEYDGFGFPLSKEGGGWAYALTHYPFGGVTNLGTPDPACISLVLGSGNVEIPVDTVSTTLLQVGDITRYLNSFKGVTHSPSLVSLGVYLPTNTVNFVSFDMEFMSTNSAAKGLLSVYWDADTLGSVDEQAVLPGLRHYTYAFPNTTAGSTHVLSFRVDPFTNMQSIVIVTNIVLGIAGPSEPFRLSMTTNMIGNLRVMELTGQSNFNYSVEASTNLINWQTIAWLVNTNGSVRFFDQGSTNFGQRFYRASYAP